MHVLLLDFEVNDTCEGSDVRFREILSAWKFQWNIAFKFHENFKIKFNT